MKYMFYILRSGWILFLVLSSPSNAKLVSICERCNDSRTPAELCSQTNEVVICRDDEPYCLTQITSTGNGLKVMKGCASEVTCLNKWWIETQNNPNCSSTLIVDESIPVGTTCTFCCHDPEQLSVYCNRNNIPDYLMLPESHYGSDTSPKLTDVNNYLESTHEYNMNTSLDPTTTVSSAIPTFNPTETYSHFMSTEPMSTISGPTNAASSETAIEDTRTSDVTTECFDHYLGNCTADFPDGCGDPFISAICPRTCQNCPDVTTECRDHYIGSCTDDFQDNCNDALIQAICPKTCRVCNHEPPTALPTDVTSECRDYYIGSCTDDFKDNCDDTLIQAICPKTCRVCNQELTTLEQTSITLPPTTEETTSTTASTTVAPTSGSCVQCGEPEFSVPCNSMELLLDTPSPCMEPGKFLCMTDAATDSDGVTSIYKRCVNQPTCHTLWYLESSNQNVCRNFDSLTTDVSCHFCCIHDGCNTGTVPAEATLYNGHL